MDIGEKLGELVPGNRRERKPDKAGKDDRARRILGDEMFAHRLRVDPLGAHAHEVAGIERHDLESSAVLGMLGENLADFVVAGFEHVVLLLLLRIVRIHVGVSGKRHRLADGSCVGDRASDVACGLGLQRLELIVVRALESEGDESDAKPPDVIFLGGAVELDREHILRKIGEIGEKRFVMLWTKRKKMIILS